MPPFEQKLSAAGDTSGCANEFASSVKCGAIAGLQGKQQYFRVTLPGGKFYQVTAKPTAATFDLALYAFTDTTCNPAAVNIQCPGAYSNSGAAGGAETIKLSPMNTTSYIIAVDSAQASSIHAGSFTLSVEDVTAPVNPSCSLAKSLTFSSGTASTSGDSSKETNDFGYLVTCGDSTFTFNGPQTYHKVALKGKQHYKIEEIKPAANDTCQTAQQVTLVNGKATLSGTKQGATDKLAKCGSKILAATDLWYRFTPASGATYKITFKPQGGGGRFGVWDGNHKCVASAVESACGVLSNQFIQGGSSGSLSITSKSGDIYFVADGVSSSYDVYSYTFTVEKK